MNYLGMHENSMIVCSALTQMNSRRSDTVNYGSSDYGGFPISEHMSHNVSLKKRRMFFGLANQWEDTLVEESRNDSEHEF